MEKISTAHLVMRASGLLALASTVVYAFTGLHLWPDPVGVEGGVRVVLLVGIHAIAMILAVVSYVEA